MRRSINLGGGFRVNVSKSGVGYSWGVKGYRVTKTAKGTIRHTASIPGTGISFVEETKKRKNGACSENAFNKNPKSIDNNHYDTKDIVNVVTPIMVSEGLEELLTSANKVLKTNKVINIGIWISLFLSFSTPVLLIISIVLIIAKIYVRTKGVVDLEYIIEDDQKAVVDDRMNPMIRITSCKKVWRIMQTSKVLNKNILPVLQIQ